MVYINILANNDDIERKKLEMPTIGDNLDNIPAGDLEKASVSDEDQQIYEDIHSKSGWTKTKEFFNRTWHGKNKFGRYLGLGLDVGESFLPKYVARIRNIFQSQTNTSNMKWLKNRLKERTTWQGIVSVLTALGVGLSPDQKEAIITAGAAIVTAIWVFVKEPQSEDAK